MTSDHVRLHYVDVGSGKPIVLVPGWSMPASIWSKQIEEFRKHYRVIVLDPRGQGDSESTSTGQFSERRGDDIHELLTELRLDSVTLIGWSMAVPEVLSYIDRHGTQRLRGVVLVDGLVSPLPTDQLSAFFTWSRGYLTDRKAWTEAFVKSMFAKSKEAAYLSGLVTDSMKLPQAAGFSLLMYYGFVDFSAALSKLDKPLLFVCEPQAKDQLGIVKKLAPQAQGELFENAGHALFVDEPERFNLLIREFVDQDHAARATR